MKPTHLDLFSGIGGFAIAAQSVGFETIGFSEIEPYACKVLKKHWPTIPNYGDVRTVPTIRCDLITGGFPCPPFSLAGKRRGAEDDRYLWPSMWDVIKRCRPTFICGENVPGIIGMELDKVLLSLESIGYRVQPLVIPACAVDAPHRRDRVWIVAHGNGSGLEKQRQQSAREERPTLERSGSIVSNSTSAQSQWGWNGPGRGQRSQGDADRSGTQRAMRWAIEPDVRRVAHGIPNRPHRLRGLGNAIVPQVAQVILQAIHQALTR